MTSDALFTAVVPAAGVGSRMQADRPKQYLELAGKSILEHTLERLMAHPRIGHVVIALHPDDPYFDNLPIAGANWLTRVDGGQERADSVLAGLEACEQQSGWVLVHDAARPCIRQQDLNRLFALAEQGQTGGILASPVRDTMKRGDTCGGLVAQTVCREGLWHALTPQFFPFDALYAALTDALAAKVAITDEASAIEWAGGKVRLVEGSPANIKITRPADLALAQFYLTQEA